MAEKKKTKPTAKTKPAKKATPKAKKPVKKPAKKATKSKKEPKNTSFADSGIVIVDDDMEFDQEKVNEERRAYLEEARSQEAFD